MHDDGHLRAITTWLGRTSEKATELASQWSDLAGFVIPGGGGGDGTGIRATTVHAAAPIRIEVVALRDDIAAWSAQIQPLVYGTLRMGLVPRGTDTPTRVRFVGHVLPRLYAEDEALCEEVAAAIWDMHRKAAGIIDPIRGTIRRPFRIDDPCPACGELALWVHPARWLIGCGMPACREVWGIDQPVLVGSDVMSDPDNEEAARLR